MNISGNIAVVTGAASGIGQAVALEFIKNGVKHLALVDFSDQVLAFADQVNEMDGDTTATAFVGDVTDAAFRERVFTETKTAVGLIRICVPAAGITRDALAVKINKETGMAEVYSIDKYRQVLEVNLLAPVYWSMQMMAGIAQNRKDAGLKKWNPDEETVQGVTAFIGSVSSLGNKGQVSYASTKRGLEGASETLASEGTFHGVRSVVVHPGYTDTPMARAVPEEIIRERVLPHTQLGRLCKPEEIAGTVCFAVTNDAIAGSLWASGGWHPPA